MILDQAAADQSARDCIAGLRRWISRILRQYFGMQDLRMTFGPHGTILEVYIMRDKATNSESLLGFSSAFSRRV